MIVLFVCTGNTCRSPMAQALARQYLGDGFQTLSAGINALEGDKLSVNAEVVLKEKSIEPLHHQARRLTEDMLASADYVFTMTRSQKEYLAGRYPQYRGKIAALGEWSGFGGEVTDPFGGSVEVYRRCFQELEEMMPRMVGKLKNEK